MYDVIEPPRITKYMNGLRQKKQYAPLVKAIEDAVSYLNTNPYHHSSLKTHPHKSEKGPNGEKMMRSRVTKSYRIIWYKVKNKNRIIIHRIRDHE